MEQSFKLPYPTNIYHSYNASARCTPTSSEDNLGGIHAPDIHGLTPLHYAAMHGNVEAVKLLLGIHARIDATDNKNRTALHLAVEKDHLEVVRLLLEEGADVLIQDKDGRTVFVVATQKHTDILEL